MGAKQEATVRAFLELFDQAPDADFDRLVSYFAEDGYYQPKVPGAERLRGRPAIREDFVNQCRACDSLAVDIREMFSTDRRVLVERIDRCVVNQGPQGRLSKGVALQIAAAAVFELDEAGLITAWRDYMDNADIARQFAAAPAPAAP